MRQKLPVVTALAMLAFASPAGAVTLTNLDSNSVQILVCDENCPGQSDDWGSAFDFWLAPGETKTFACSGACFVGTYYDGHSPTLGDMAVADDDEMFSGDEHGYIQNGFARHNPE